jgi:hypothetical protein
MGVVGFIVSVVVVVLAVAIAIDLVRDLIRRLNRYRRLRRARIESHAGQVERDLTRHANGGPGEPQGPETPPPRARLRDIRARRTPRHDRQAL